MKKIRNAIIMILLGFLFLIPWIYSPRDHQQDETSLTPQAELQMKEALVDTDVRRTEELCRNQCAISFADGLRTIEPGKPEQIRSQLESMQQMHPHMSKLQYLDLNYTTKPVAEVGSVEAQVANLVNAFEQEAVASIQKGQTYESPPISTPNGTYFVMSVPSADSSHALLGVINQNILQDVRQHQVNNLRVIPYPAEGNFRIESVDSTTLSDVNVTHPEHNEGTSHYHKYEVVVRFNRTMSGDEIQQIQTEIQSKSVRTLGYTYVFESETMEAKQLMSYFQKWPVVYAEPHYLYLTNDAAPKEGTPTSVTSDKPNDLLYNRYQWNLPIIETEQGWGVGKGSNQVVVGVVDTGVDLNHPDLKGHLLKGTNIVQPDASPIDDVGHGTHVAGIISAIVNNGQGVAGMTWYNPVLPIKVLDQSGAGSTYAVAQGVIWATDHGAKVINMSLGNYADANFLHDAIRYAFDHDVVLVAASGNDNTEQPGFPAAYPEVLAVAATDANKKRATFSNYGDYIDVSAPGVSIASTFMKSQYAALSGTSMASPHVSALAALIRSVNPQLKNTEVMDVIRRTAEDLGPRGQDKYYGYGQIDVVKALQAAQQAGQAKQPIVNEQSQLTELKPFGKWLNMFIRWFYGQR